MAQELKHAFLVGRLVLSPSNDGDGQWLKLEVPQAIANGLFAALHEPGLSLPPGKSHVSVMLSDEVAKIGATKITEVGKFFPFRIEALKHVKPSGWNAVSQVYFVVVKSPELKKLRASYGLTPLVKGDHEFHISVAIRKKGVLAPNNSITKHAFVGRELLIPALAGAAGAGLGSMVDKRRKSKGSWLQRNIGLLLGGLAGTGAGYGLNKLPASSVRDTSEGDTGQSAMDTIRPADDSTLQTKNPLTGAEQRYLERGGVPAVEDYMPSTSVSDIAHPMMYSLSQSATDPLTWGLNAGLSSIGGLFTKLPEGASQTMRGINAVKGLANVPSGVLGFAGAGGAATATDKLHKSLGMEDSPLTMGHELLSANVGGQLSSAAANKVVEGAKPIAARWWPKLMKVTNPVIKKYAPSLLTTGRTVSRFNAPLSAALEAAGPLSAAIGGFGGAESGKGLQEAGKAWAEAAPDTLVGNMAGWAANKIYGQ